MTTTVSPDEIKSTDSEIRRLDEKFTLLESFVRTPRPWYRDISRIISLAAFTISILTTLISGYKEYKRDVSDRVNQIHEIISQINSTNIQVFEEMEKYKGDQMLTSLTSSLNGQTLILARQAYGIISSLKNEASVSDILAVASILGTSGEQSLAEKLLDEASPRVSNALDDVSLFRFLGNIRFSNGDVAAGNAAYANAAAVFSKFPEEAGSNKQFAAITSFWTEIYWAGGLLRQDCPASLLHIANAEKLLPQVTGGFKLNDENTIAEINRLKEAAGNCIKPPTMSAN